MTRPVEESSLQSEDNAAEVPQDCTKPKNDTTPQVRELPGGEEWGLGHGYRPDQGNIGVIDPVKDLRDRNRRSGGHNVA
jgi:hypothetical protein